MKAIVTLLLSILTLSAIAQDTLGNHILYKAEEQVIEANSGIETYVPRGWVGVEPRNEEAFLFIPVNHSDAQMMIMIYEKDKGAHVEDLKEGLQVAHDITVLAKDPLQLRNNWIAANLEISEAGRDVSGYAETNCEKGFCVVNILIADRKDLDALKYSLYRVSDNMQFHSEVGKR